MLAFIGWAIAYLVVGFIFGFIALLLAEKILGKGDYDGDEIILMIFVLGWPAIVPVCGAIAILFAIWMAACAVGVLIVFGGRLVLGFER
jgi:hypothetical protein